MFRLWLSISGIILYGVQLDFVDSCRDLSMIVDVKL